MKDKNIAVKLRVKPLNTVLREGDVYYDEENDYFVRWTDKEGFIIYTRKKKGEG